MNDKKLQASEFLQPSIDSSFDSSADSFRLRFLLRAETLLFGKSKGVNGEMSAKVSQRYQLWHDKLVQAVRVAMPPQTPYTVVHAQKLVGLFTCIFVKNAETLNLRDIAVTTVKRGMAGTYGNKVSRRRVSSFLSRSILVLTSARFTREPFSLVSLSMTLRSASSTAISLLVNVRNLLETPSVSSSRFLLSLSPRD